MTCINTPATPITNWDVPFHSTHPPKQRLSTRKTSFAKMHMYCIVLADRPHRSWKHNPWKRTFLKTGLRVEKSKNAALPFSCGWRIRILYKTMTPSPHTRPLASDLWTPRRLTTTTTTTMVADNMLVLIVQQILNLLGLLGQNITLLCHCAEQKMILDNQNTEQKLSVHAPRCRLFEVVG